MVGVLIALSAYEWRTKLRPIFKTASDGSPRAQAKLAEKLRRARSLAVLRVDLEAGKRGHYRITLWEWVGWDPTADKAIVTRRAAMPVKPWLAIRMFVVEGMGRGERKTSSTPIVLVSHHAISRLMQRLHDHRTVYDLYRAVRGLWEAFDTLRERVGPDAVFTPPPGGWRLPLSGGCAILEPHEVREKCLVAVTALSEPEGPYALTSR